MHPAKVLILERLLEGVMYSPKQLEPLLDMKLGDVAYHMRWLQREGFVVLVDTQPRRGAVEHFYQLAP